MQFRLHPRILDLDDDEGVPDYDYRAWQVTFQDSINDVHPVFRSYLIEAIFVFSNIFQLHLSKKCKRIESNDSSGDDTPDFDGVAAATDDLGFQGHVDADDSLYRD